ncbi:YtxH domain-containing protein [Sporosarcina siberiensis]|uniref:YtxH domain-containing protein n=1 Tax=Sporosarcina siberiensis TaxID=1365606 RepID=A0ABW4SEJ6_9BACL
MNEENNLKTNYNDSQNQKNTTGDREYENSYGQQTYLPHSYDYQRGYTDSFYDEYESSNASSFLVGAIVGGVIGAAAALFLAPKTGKEMREDFSTQATHLKDKSIEISTVAKDKASEYTSVAKDKASEYTAVAKDKASEFSTVAKEKANEFTTVAKEKTEGVTKTIQEQSEHLVDKVKSMKSKVSAPMDDGTASSEGEEAVDYVEVAAEISKEDLTATAEALKEAVTGKK